MAKEFAREDEVELRDLQRKRDQLVEVNLVVLLLVLSSSETSSCWLRVAVCRTNGPSSGGRLRTTTSATPSGASRSRASS